MSVSVCMYVCLSVYVCVCLSVRDHIFGTTRPIFTNFTCMLPVAVARSSSGGVVICRVLPVLRYDVMSAHNPRRFDVAAQLRRSSHAALGLAINGG